MKTFVIAFFISVVTFSTNATTGSQPLTPYQAIKQTGDKLFTRIANSQQALEKFPDLMRDIVEEELMPTIDYRYAAFKILGKHLRKTSKSQREKFVESMRYYLVRTYASALHQYKDQQVTYQKSAVKKKAKMASINALITEMNKPDIRLTFQMRQNKKTKQWKAYDLVVEGISLLSAKQAEFKGRISKHGIDQVTIELATLGK